MKLKKLKTILFSYLVATGIAFACTPQREAEDAYTAEHLGCVEKAKTKTEADACRQQVRARWHELDGGTDQ